MAALPFPVPLGALPGPAAGTFRALFPEFQTAPDALVQSRLDMAAVTIDPRVWGDRAGEGQCYRAAHLLATAPGGSFARLISKDGTTNYGKQYDRMVVEVTCLIMRVV